MDVIVPPGLLDGAHHVLFERRIARRIRAPAKTVLAILTRPQSLWPAQRDADIIAPAHVGGEAQDLFFVAAVPVEEDQQRVRIIRLVAGWQEGADRLFLNAVQR